MALTGVYGGRAGQGKGEERTLSRPRLTAEVDRRRPSQTLVLSCDCRHVDPFACNDHQRRTGLSVIPDDAGPCNTRATSGARAVAEV